VPCNSSNVSRTWHHIVKTVLCYGCFYRIMVPSDSSNVSHARYLHDAVDFASVYVSWNKSETH